MSGREDENDVERVMTGDVAAFEGIVRRWQGPLINLAYRFCRDRYRAEDMAQEAFLRIYRSLHLWHKNASFSTWMFAVATNLYRSELRRIPARTVSLSDVPEPTGPGSPSDRLERQDQSRAVRLAVLALPAKYREAVTLFYFHGMDLLAASQSLDLPQGTVKARLFRGRKLLYRKLQDLLRLPSPKEGTFDGR